MSSLVYIERTIRDNPVARRILERTRADTIVEIDRYGEIFNPKSQNFRLQKQNPALIVAQKHGNRVLQAPSGYGIGGNHNYYFSHMMNCMYDCRYCFLQGMYQSANHVVFANYEDFFAEISTTSLQHTNEDVWFFSGYDCDSLALEPLTHFMRHCLDYFSDEGTSATSEFSACDSSEKMRAPINAHLEIRTKSTQIRDLLDRPANPKCVVAYSLSPQPIVESLEHKTPSLQKRIRALQQLQESGWLIGLRFDPLIAAENFKDIYTDMFDEVFSSLDTSMIHSISLGTFRLPKSFFRKVIKLYPEEPMFAVAMEQSNEQLTEQKNNARSNTHAMIGYPADMEQDMMNFCTDRILGAIDKSRFFPCIA